MSEQIDIISDESARKRRKLAGGNGSKQFVEGWVEFADKKIAKKVNNYNFFISSKMNIEVAESLNNTAMDGRKRGFYHDDMWSMKYLKNFKYVMTIKHASTILVDSYHQMGSLN